MIRQENKPARFGDCWTPEELEYLANHYGLIPKKRLARHLKRSEKAVAKVAKKKLHGLRQKDNFYTALDVARSLGIPDSKRIIRWVERGWLKGKRAPMRQGPYPVWLFREGDIVKCLQQRPWLLELKGMPEHYFRSVVKREWESDPWYTCKHAAPLLGIKTPFVVYRYIYRGWLPAIKKPWGGQGVWIIRRSAIQAFLNHDPRPQHRRSAWRRRLNLAQ